MSSGKKVVIKTFSDFEDEMRQFLPAGDDIEWAVTDPLERYFFEVADKHGILDRIIDGDYE